MHPVAPGDVIDAGIKDLVDHIQYDYFRKPLPGFVYTLSGGFYLPAALNTALTNRMRLGPPFMVPALMDQVNLLWPPKELIEGKDIILVDTVIGKGSKLHALIELLMKQGARQVDVCCLIIKNVQRKHPIVPKYCAYRSENYWHAGFGLELNGSYSAQSYIGIPKETLKPHQYPKPVWRYMVDHAGMW